MKTKSNLIDIFFESFRRTTSTDIHNDDYNATASTAKWTIASRLESACSGCAATNSEFAIPSNDLWATSADARKYYSTRFQSATTNSSDCCRKTIARWPNHTANASHRTGQTSDWQFSGWFQWNIHTANESIANIALQSGQCIQLAATTATTKYFAHDNGNNTKQWSNRAEDSAN